jgi:O-antigen/teichoic acid export membrane protein
MFIGTAVYAGGQFATLVVLAKLLPPEFVGRYALGLALVYPVMAFTNLQLKAVVTSEIRREIHFGHYVTLRLLTTLTALLIIFGITQALRYERELTAAVLMVAVVYSIEAISDVYYARLQLHDRMDAISKSMIARAVLSVLGVALATYVTRSVVWGLTGIAVARTIVLFAYDLAARTHGLAGASNVTRREALGPRVDVKVQRALLSLSLPLGVIVLLGCLNTYMPSYFIKHWLGERELGIFATIGFVVSVGNMAVVSLGQSAFTRLSRAYNSGNSSVFASLLVKLVAFGAGIGAVGMVVSKLAGRELLTIVFRPEYAQRADLLPWIMAAGGVMYMAQFLGFGLTAAGFYNSQVFLNVAASASLVVACYLLSDQGFWGVILAMLIAAIVQFAASLGILIIGVRTRSNVCTEPNPA